MFPLVLNVSFLYTSYSMLYTNHTKKWSSTLALMQPLQDPKTTPKRFFYLVIDHYEKLLPLDEFRLSPSYRWPWSSSAHVECRLFSGPLHHLLLLNIWKDALWPYTDEGNKFSSLSCENRTKFFLKWMANYRS